MWTSLANGPARSRGELESFDIGSLTVFGKSLDLPVRKSLSSNNLSSLTVMLPPLKRDRNTDSELDPSPLLF